MNKKKSKVDVGSFVKEHLPIVVVLVFSFLVRLFFVLKFDKDVFANDGYSYISIADNLLSGNGLINTAGKVSILTPVYPIFLAVIRLFTNKIFFIRLIQAVLSSATVWLIYEIGCKVKDKRVGVLAAVLSSVYPGLVLYSAMEITEVLYTFFLTLVFLLFIFHRKELDYKKISIVGLVIGVVTLIRGNYLYLPVIFVWYILFTDVKLLEKVKLIGILLVSSFILPIMWGVRNYVMFDDFVLTACHGGQALYLGNNEYSEPLEYHSSATDNYDLELWESLDNIDFVERDKILGNEAKEYIFENPLKFVENTAIRYCLFWKPANIRIRNYQYFTNRLYFMDSYLIWIFAASVIVGLRDLFRDSNKNILILGSLAYGGGYAISTVLKDARYRSPIMPIVIILVSLLSVEVIDFILLYFQKYKKSKFSAKRNV
jgi:4-amino-4-deoxy-L-arabinose transferase-like glycosyltransferase